MSFISAVLLWPCGASIPEEERTYQFTLYGGVRGGKRRNGWCARLNSQGSSGTDAMPLTKQEMFGGSKQVFKQIIRGETWGTRFDGGYIPTHCGEAAMDGAPGG